ncbi:MAG: S-formylglutathione hydrolase [Myxococcota bacterium]|jgi:S-formylglutathione hydrolase
MAAPRSGLETVSSNRSFGGEQRVVTHDSAVLGCPMKFAVYLPADYEGADLPVVYFLSGLTCSEQNVIGKGNAQQACAEAGVILVCPDTSPRGADVADDAAWDLGQGAGFYLNATREPWAQNYRMAQYVTEELPGLVTAFTGNEARGITGHSMGGHGALVLALRNPGMYQSVSAFAPILEPSHVPWGHKAFGAYLGDDRARWAEWDTTQLIAAFPYDAIRLPMLIDQGSADGFLENQLTAARFLEACGAHGQPVNYRVQRGYDHSYYFIATFMGEHIAHHAAALR